jgi:5-methylcytosine-specific restriction protein B
VPGIFKELCDLANEHRTKQYVLIIDEINRGQPSRILGELINLLEYRDKPILLPYSKKKFLVPRNLYLISTMNSTDRSVAFMDYAIRRRFGFYKLEPSKSILTKWFERHKPEMDSKKVMELFENLNTIIKDKLGEEFKIGHSYYMLGDALTIEKLNLIWNYTIKPLLEEYFFDDKDKIKICQDLFDKSNKESNNYKQTELLESKEQIGTISNVSASQSSPNNTNPRKQ